MKTYYLSYWIRDGEETFLSVDAENVEDLYYKLKEKYKDQEFNKDVNLHGYNYTYITNASHCLAAGYMDLISHLTIAGARAPAHFNQSFFYILGWIKKLST